MGTEFKHTNSELAPQKKEVKGKNEYSASDFVRKMKSDSETPTGEIDYRSASLKIHGTVCARCGRDFAGKNLRQLTVHHLDSNSHNNPKDGSNWENLCIYCHEAEHSKELLGNYVQKAKTESPRSKNRDANFVHEEKVTVTLADMLKQAMEKKNK